MKKRRGFTLLETLLAMVILSSGLVLLANSWSGSFMRIRKTKFQHEVAVLLERKATEIEMKYRNKALTEIPEEESDDFGSEYPNYSWKMISQDFQMPDLSAALTARDGGANDMMTMVMKQMADHFSKSVKEVKITVIIKNPKKNLEYSIVTYFVDYNKELALGGGSP